MAVIPDWPSDRNGFLRQWQQKCWTVLERYLFTARDTFLCVACPGAGKTRLASYASHFMLRETDINYVIIVCPSEHLTVQWYREAARYGIHLGIKPDKDGTALVLPDDMHGMVVTYQAIAANTKAFQTACQRKKVLFIGDEIHHAGNQLAWGEALQTAFEKARFKLLLSGTPFRSDNKVIPFVTYEQTEDGTMRSKADYSYGYGDALFQQDVVRQIWFPTFDADAEWYSNGQIMRARFNDDLSPKQSSELLRTVLWSEDWLSEVLRDASRKLDGIREAGHTNAGALTICVDKKHAELVAAVLRRIGEKCTVVTSDDPFASSLIEQFRDGTDRWLVAVRMVSEGVDIKRLRVGVYATNILTEMYFRQVVGRFVRHDSSLDTDDQSASLYFPKDPRLYAYAQGIREEREHVLRELANRLLQDYEPFLRTEETMPGLFKPMGAQALEDVVIGHNIEIDPALRPRAEQIRAQLGTCDSWEKIAAILQLGGLGATPKQPAEDVPEPRHDRKRKLRSLIGSLCGTLAFHWQRNTGIDYEIKDVHAQYIRISGKRQNELTLEELEEKVKWLQREISEAGDE